MLLVGTGLQHELHEFGSTVDHGLWVTDEPSGHEAVVEELASDELSNAHVVFAHGVELHDELVVRVDLEGEVPCECVLLVEGNGSGGEGILSSCQAWT